MRSILVEMNMKKQCEKCKAFIAEGEVRMLHGQMLCQDCCIKLLSPAKACDPRAVYSAKKFIRNRNNGSQVSPFQQKILDLLRKEGPADLTKLSEQLKISTVILVGELAALRHMERIRGELQSGVRLIRLWD